MAKKEKPTISDEVKIAKHKRRNEVKRVSRAIASKRPN
jgi:hypothetical protein